MGIQINGTNDTITANDGTISILGSLTGTNSTFSGDVGVAGTLTYEDVTNIDSVGIITARDGLKVLAGGANVVGVVTASAGITVSAGTATFQGAIDANSDLDVDGHTNLDNVSIAGVTTFQNDLNLGDNDILRIGNSSDLQLYHDGNSHVSDRGGAGSLWVESNNQVVIKQNDVNHYMAIFNQGGASELRYNNSTKISTTNTGSIITSADFDKSSNLLALTSTISFNEYYLLIIDNFSIENKDDYKIKMYEIPVGKTQIEGIKIINSSTFWLTSEQEKKGDPKLFKIKI